MNLLRKLRAIPKEKIKTLFSKVRLILLLCSFVIAGLGLLNVLNRSFGVYWKIDNINRFMGFCAIMFLLCPLYWFTYVKGINKSIPMIILYSIWLILPFSSTEIIWTWWTLSSVWKNKLQKVYSVKVDKNVELTIYNKIRKNSFDNDPDLYPVIVKNIFLGLEKREYLSRRDMYWNPETDSTELLIYGTKYSIPKPPELNKIAIDLYDLKLHPNERYQKLIKRGTD